MIRHLRHGVAAVLAGLALVAAPTVPAVATTPPATVITVLGDGGWLAGRSTMAVPVSATALALDDYDWVDAAGGSEEQYVSLWLRAPLDTRRLAVGRYEARRSPDMTRVGLDLSVSWRGCNAFTGTVDVLDLARDDQGLLSAVAFDYAVTCDDEPTPVRGSFRWNIDAPYQHTQVSDLRLPDTVQGRTAHGEVVLTNTGHRNQTYGPSTWQPSQTGSAPVVVERDGCSGTTLAPGASCRVGIGAASDGVRAVDGHLRTPDGTARGAAYSQVSMHAVPAPTAVVVTATPRRGGVQLSSSAFHPSYRVLRSVAGGPETEVARGVPMPWTDTTAPAGTRSTYRVVPTSGGVEGPVSAPATTGPLPVPVGQDGTFVPVDPVRVLDTRDGTGARRGAVGPGEVLLFDPAATGAIPTSGASAVLLNVTGTQPTAVTHVRVWPAGEPRPETSSLNLVPGQSRPNQVVVPLGQDGRVALANNAGSTHLVVDVQGFYSEVDGPAGGGYHPIAPERVLDTREDGGPLGPGEEAWIPVSATGVDWSRVAAVDVNLTVTQPTGDGHLTAWAGDAAAPAASNVNFAPAQTVANHAVVPVSVDENGEPGIALRNSTGSTHVVVDVQGWYDDDASSDGLRFAASPTARVGDSRTGPDRGPLAPGGSLVVPGSALPPAVAHVVNVTATQGSGGGHLTAWTGQGTPPWTSSVNFGRGEDSPNLATALAGSDGRIAVTAGSSSVHVVVDHLGFFY